MDARAECRGRVARASVLKSGGSGLNYRPVDRMSFPRPLQANATIFA